MLTILFTATGAIVGLQHDHFLAALFSQAPCCHDPSSSGPDDNDSGIVKVRHDEETFD